MILSKFRGAVLICAYLPLVALGQSATKHEIRLKGESVRCPKIYMADLKTGTFFNLREAIERKDRVCFRSKKIARKYFREIDSTQMVPIGVQTVSEFDLTGQAQANTPAFFVGVKPVLVNFSYDGSGRFYIELRDAVTGRKAQTLVRSAGQVAGNSYILKKGVFYLKVYGNPRSDDGTNSGSWEVSLSSGE